MTVRTTRIDPKQSEIQNLRTRLQALENEYTTCFDIQRRVTLLKEIESMKQEISALETSITRYLGHLTQGQLDYLTRVGAKTPEEINRALVEYENIYTKNIDTLDTQQNGTGTTAAATMTALTWRNWNNLTTGKPLVAALNDSYLFGNIHTIKPDLPNGNILTLGKDAGNAYLSIPGKATNTGNTSWLQRFGRTPLQRSIDRALEQAAANGGAATNGGAAVNGGAAAGSIPKGTTATLADDVATQTSNLLANQSDDILRETTRQARHLNDVATQTQTALTITSGWKNGWGAAFKSGFSKTNVAITVGTAAVSTGLEVIDDVRENGHMTKRSGKAAIEEGLGAAGALAAAGIGAKAGAVVGSFIPVPVVGTVVGFVAGAAIGAAGYYIGKSIGKLINSWW